jgi:phosphomevalonate kinase
VAAASVDKAAISVEATDDIANIRRYHHRVGKMGAAAINPLVDGTARALVARRIDVVRILLKAVGHLDPILAITAPAELAERSLVVCRGKIELKFGLFLGFLIFFWQTLV